MLDRNGQPLNKNFNKYRNLEKSVCSLKGILQGIIADNKLDALELAFLDAWLKQARQLDTDPTASLISEYVSAALANPNDPMIVSRLRYAIDHAIEDLAIGFSDREAKTNELLGLLDGVTSDTRLIEQEIRGIQRWLEENPEQLDYYPGSAIAARLRSILADNVVTADELAEFKDVIKKISGNKLEETGQVIGGSSDFLCDPIAELVFVGRCYCFTGKFLSGTRPQVEAVAQSRGASTSSSITKKVDYLVVGVEQSRDWRFTSYGRKIEKAMQLKDEGHQISILTEEIWVSLAMTNR